MFKVYYNDISIIRGDTGFFAINICNSNGESVSLADDDVLIFTVRANPNAEIAIQKRLTGTNKLVLEPSDTADLEFSKYCYDVQLTRADGYVDTVIPPHTFRIMEEVTY